MTTSSIAVAAGTFRYGRHTQTTEGTLPHGHPGPCLGALQWGPARRIPAIAGFGLHLAVANRCSCRRILSSESIAKIASPELDQGLSPSKCCCRLDRVSRYLTRLTVRFRTAKWCAISELQIITHIGIADIRSTPLRLAWSRSVTLTPRSRPLHGSLEISVNDLMTTNSGLV